MLPFAGEDALGASHHRHRASRPGAQRPVPRARVPALDPLPTETSPVNFGDWRTRLADALVLGSVARVPGRPLRGALPRLRRRQAGAARRHRLRRSRKDSARATAHRIADFVYEKLTGEKGVFSTRIAYVVKRGTAYELQIADADGAGRPDRAALARADHLAGLVARRHAPRLRVVREQEAGGLRALARRRASARWWRTSRARTRAPAWSPDGKQLAVVLSRDGGSQIFLINADGSGARRRITQFGVDRHRAALLARRQVDLFHLRPRRQPADLPHERRPAASRSASPSRAATMCRRAPARRQDPGVRDAQRRQVPGGAARSGESQVQVLTDSDRDESPSFAPNGRMILLATVIGGRGVLSAVSADGRVKQRLPFVGRRCARAGLGPVHRMKGETHHERRSSSLAVCAAGLLFGARCAHHARGPEAAAGRGPSAAEPAPRRAECRRQPAPAVDLTSKPRRRRRIRSRIRTTSCPSAAVFLRLRQVRRQGRVQAWSRRTPSTCARTPARRC